MMILKVSELKVGASFTKPVYIDESNLLVAENVPIKQKEIDRLVRWGISEVRTEGSLVEAGGPSATSVTLSSFLRAAPQQDVLKAYGQMTEAFRELQKTVKEQNQIESTAVDKVVDGIVGLVAKSSDDLVQFLLFGAQGESDTAQNAVNCAVYSVLMGISLNMIQHKLLKLATGALLHDIGMLRVNDEIINKTAKLEPVELQRIRAHTVFSYRIITKELRYPEDIGLIALQHHERWDGEGYPKKLAGKQISLAARIVSVADAFEAMVSERPYRDPMIGYNAMRSLLSDNGRRFDPDVLKVFIRSMGLYPIGSIVLLSNSCIARVVANNHEASLRPQVKIMINQEGRAVEDGELVDLNTDKTVFIAKAVDPKNIGKSPAP